MQTQAKKANSNHPNVHTKYKKASSIFNLIGLRLKLAAKRFCTWKKVRADVKMLSLTNSRIKSIKKHFKNSSIENLKQFVNQLLVGDFRGVEVGVFGGERGWGEGGAVGGWS